MNGERPVAPGALRITVLGSEPIVVEVATPGPEPADIVRAGVAPADPEPGRAGIVARLMPRGSGAVHGPARYEVIVDGWRFEVEVESAARAALRERASRAGLRGQGSGRQVVRAQIPGRIVSVAVRVGEVVEAGQRLLSVEAMKMENAVIAPWAGTIARVGIVAGETVELGDELVVIE